MEVLVLGGPQGFESEVVDDEEIDAGQLDQLAVEAVGGSGGMDLGEHSGSSGEQDVISGPDGAVAQSLGDVALPGAAGTDDEAADLFLDEPAGGQLGDQGAVDARIEGEVKLFQGLLVPEGGPADGRGDLLLVPPGDLVLDDGGQEVHVRDLSFDGLPVPGLDGIEDAGEAQLLEHGDQFGHGVHGHPPFSVDLQFRPRAQETPADGVDGGKGKFGRRRLLIQAHLQDVLHGAVPGVVVEQGSLAGALQADGPVLLPQADDALGGPQVVQDAVPEEMIDQLKTVDADLPGPST